jgi:hypothetical protein
MNANHNSIFIIITFIYYSFLVVVIVTFNQPNVINRLAKFFILLSLRVTYYTFYIELTWLSYGKDINSFFILLYEFISTRNCHFIMTFFFEREKGEKKKKLYV